LREQYVKIGMCFDRLNELQLLMKDKGGSKDQASGEGDKNTTQELKPKPLVKQTSSGKYQVLVSRRQFATRELAKKHVEQSTLYRDSLLRLIQLNQILLSPEGAEAAAAAAEQAKAKASNTSNAYIDRAKERRQLHGQPNMPGTVGESQKERENRLQEELARRQAALEANLKRTVAVASGAERAGPQLDESNIGMAMLQKMGWAKDRGLGKSGQGITEPVQAAQPAGNAGLGASSLGVAGVTAQTAGVHDGDNFASATRKIMRARYEAAEKQA